MSQNGPMRQAPYRPRSLVPVDADLSCGDTVERLYQSLLDRRIDSGRDLARLIDDHSELCSALDEHRSLLDLAALLDTEDATAARANTHFLDCLIPAIEALEIAYKQKYLDAAEDFGSRVDIFKVYDRASRADMRIYVADNTARKTRERQLADEYRRICGSVSVRFEGREYSVAAMSVFGTDRDRGMRERAWRVTRDAWRPHAGRLDEIFSELVALRHIIARETGFDNYVDYAFQAQHRFDYTPNQMRDLHTEIESCVVPQCREIQARRRDRIDVRSLRPWDFFAPVLGENPLRPFTSEEELITKMGACLGQTDDQFAIHFEELKRSGHLDLYSRKRKGQGGYCYSLNECRKPFIFLNVAGTDKDMWDLFHEFGHAFHNLTSAHQEPFALRDPPLEFAEFAAFGMEFFAGENLDTFYPAGHGKRSRSEFLERKIENLPWLVVGDAFQHWVYANPGHSISDRHEAWARIYRTYMGDIEWPESELGTDWHRILHFFQFPMYCIEYVLATVGALQLWIAAKDDAAKALRNYKRALSLGGSKPLPDLFREADVAFDFSNTSIAPLMQRLREEVARLHD